MLRPYTQTIMRNHTPRHRPPWWPENETWPPHRPWRAGREHLFRRIGVLLVVLALLVLIGCGTVLTFLASALGLIDASVGDIGIVRVLGVLIIFFVVASVFSTVRRAVVPLGDVMDAADKVAEGDYAVRVEERGPRELRKLARSFNTMTVRLHANDEQRRALLADVTHELRTPLTVIQGNLEGMLDGIYPPDQVHLESTLEETRVLSRLIDDLRTLSLAESGALKLQREPVELRDLINETLAVFQAAADHAGVQLSADVQVDVPQIEVDPLRVRQVLSNLIANALRYTSQGGQIQVRAIVEQADRITVIVSDTGRGIAPEDLPHIFDRFYKSSDSRGTGLGLAIARNLVAAHGGDISAHSTLGHGTTITFILPLKS
ncbi:MAG: HAMP domain-containing histidine kinase [Chloroflexi bacterium]|nr:HAMP domain-containing histidine kinase [Chloroflexota bacterium]